MKKKLMLKASNQRHQFAADMIEHRKGDPCDECGERTFVMWNNVTTGKRLCHNHTKYSPFSESMM